MRDANNPRQFRLVHPGVRKRQFHTLAECSHVRELTFKSCNHALTLAVSMLIMLGMEKSKVIAHFGGVTHTASALGVSHSAVIQWPDEIPFSAIGRIASLQPKAWRRLLAEESRQTKQRIKP